MPYGHNQRKGKLICTASNSHSTYRRTYEGVTEDTINQTVSSFKRLYQVGETDKITTRFELPPAKEHNKRQRKRYKPE